jgi:putative transposase
LEPPPNAISTDGLRSCLATTEYLGNLERREMGRHLNGGAENSHLAFRRRELAMLRLRQMTLPPGRLG